MLYFLSVVVSAHHGVLELSHTGSQEPVIKISEIFQASC